MNVIIRSILVVLPLCIPAMTRAEDHTAAREAMTRFAPGLPVTALKDAPIPGFVEAHVGARVLYASSDGRYVFEGTLTDTRDGRDLTEDSRSTQRARILMDLPEKAKISFLPDNATHRVTVFTAIDCGYCRKFHSRIDEYLAQGIGIDYVLIPLGGSGSSADETSRRVYCAQDRHAAFTAATNGTDIDVPPSCASGYTLATTTAALLGIRHTPTLVASDGTILGGYLTPAQLHERLSP